MADTHIKIKPVTPRVQYTGNGVTTTFPYDFAIFDETDMVVYVDDDIIESGYTVTGAGETEGGTVVFDTAPDDGIKITLLRDVPIERVTDFQEGGTFRPKNLNDEFDRQTAFVQQVQEILDRSVKVGPTSDVNPEEVLSQVERIYGSIENVDAVADNLTSVYAVASDLTNIDAVASNQTNINNVANNANNINSVAGNSTNINAVAGNATNINAVNANKANIDAVAGELPDIKTKANKSLDNLDATGQAVINGKADVDLNNLNSTGKGKLGPTVYVANGILLNSIGDTCEGHGTATVFLFKNGIAEVHFNIKITKTGTSSSIFTYGINRDLLTANNSNIPQITPVTGGSLTYYATNGTVVDNRMEYGGLLIPNGNFWTVARVYNTDGGAGGWPASELVQNQRLIGVCYGTYTP